MDSRSALETFAKKFVVADFRERFLHEATKRPERLHARICHNIEDVLLASLAGKPAGFMAQDSCLVLDGPKGFRSSTWGALWRKVGLGEGLLVIGNDGLKFYAETEAVKGGPSVVYGVGS